MASLRVHRTSSVRQRQPVNGRSFPPLSNQEIRRAHIKLGSKKPYEDSFVLWLQAGSWYADIRISLDSGEIYSGFGGVVWWHAPQLYFQHMINISGTLDDQDIGRIVLTRFGCFEHGTSLLLGQDKSTQDKAKIGFEEKWLMTSNKKSRVFTLTKKGVLKGLEVQTDRYCIVIIDQSITLFARHGRKKWRTLCKNTPREKCWQPTDHKPKPAWQLRESAVIA